jgi:hypothetical protein
MTAGGPPPTETPAPPRNRGDKLRRLLAHDALPIYVAVAALVLTLPSLRVGRIVDDHFHRLAMQPSGRFGEFVRSPLDMFRFISGDRDETLRKMDLGFLPWWTVPEAHAAFFRPLTTLTHWVDYRLWPNWPVLMHVQNVLWLALLVWVVARLYRRLLTPMWVAGWRR